MEYTDQELRRWGIETNTERESRLKSQTEKFFKLMIQAQLSNGLELKFSDSLIINEKEKFFIYEEPDYKKIFVGIHYENGHEKDSEVISYPNTNNYVFQNYDFLPGKSIEELEYWYKCILCQLKLMKYEDLN